jgi:lactam utilization protein B
LHKEADKLNRQLAAVKGAIEALNGASKAVAGDSAAVHSNGRRTMSAAVRARISQKAKARWAKIKAEQGKSKAAKK